MKSHFGIKMKQQLWLFVSNSMLLWSSILSNKPIMTISAHDSRVYSLFLAHGFVYSSSIDSTVKKFRIENGELMTTYYSLRHWAENLNVTDRSVYACGYEVMRWNDQTGVSEKTYTDVSLLNTNYFASLIVHESMTAMFTQAGRAVFINGMQFLI